MRKIRLPWGSSDPTEKHQAELPVNGSLTIAAIATAADDSGEPRTIVRPTIFPSRGQVAIFPGDHPLAPWESPGGAKYAFDPQTDASLSILTGWNNFAVIVNTSAGGAVSATSLIAAQGAGTRIQIGHLSYAHSWGVNSTAVNAPIESASTNTPFAYVNGVTGQHSGWNGGLVEDNEALQLAAVAGASASRSGAIWGTYRVVKA